MTAETTAPRATSSGPIGLLASVFDPFRDAWIAARARLMMLAACGSAAADVTVEAHHGRIVLGGEVASPRVRDHAAHSIHTLPGLVGVSNHVRVRGAHARRPDDTDSEVGALLTTRLHRSRAGRTNRIYIDEIYDGVVTLGGTVATEADRLAAFEIAIHTPGVRRVVSDVVLSAESGAGLDVDAA